MASTPSCRPLGGAVEPHADRGESVDRGQRRVALHDPFERLAAVEVEAVDEFAVVIAGWGPEAVAIVPARIVSWPSGISVRTAQTPRQSVDLRRSPGS